MNKIYNVISEMNTEEELQELHMNLYNTVMRDTVGNVLKHVYVLSYINNCPVVLCMNKLENIEVVILEKSNTQPVYNLIRKCNKNRTCNYSFKYKDTIIIKARELMDKCVNIGSATTEPILINLKNNLK